MISIEHNKNIVNRSPFSCQSRERLCVAVRIVAHVVLDHPEQSACLRHRRQRIHAGDHHGDAVRSCFPTGSILKRRCAGIEDARMARTLPLRIVRNGWRCRDDRTCSVNGPVLGVRENVVDEQTLKIGTMRGPSSCESPRRCQRQRAGSCSIRTTNSLTSGYSRMPPQVFPAPTRPSRRISPREGGSY